VSLVAKGDGFSRSWHSCDRGHGVACSVPGDLGRVNSQITEAIRHLWDRLTFDSPSPGAGSGRGGALGTPSLTLDEATPSLDQEKNAVVSGGGVIGSDPDRGPSREAELSPSAQSP
jgi:hypothetical protein